MLLGMTLCINVLFILHLLHARNVSMHLRGYERWGW